MTRYKMHQESHFHSIRTIELNDLCCLYLETKTLKEYILIDVYLFIIYYPKGSYHPIMCKVQKCHDKHQKHFCCICQNTDSNHFSFNCPSAKMAYYGTTTQISKKIKQHGFLPSKKGTQNEGIYFSDTIDEAKLKAQEKYKNMEIVVIECKIPENELNKETYFVKAGDSEDIVKQKLFQWYNKSKDLPSVKVKTPWANKFSCVRHNKNIKIVKFHEIK